MGWYNTVSQMIDLRSFSNLWYWIMLAVVWSAASRRILGAPHDMIVRARRDRPGARKDVETLVRIYSTRLLQIANVSGLWLVGLGFFVLSFLAAFGFLYGQEFSQALFLIALPMSLVGLISLRTARRAQGLEGDALLRLLGRQRLFTQLIGMVAITVTAFWGMWHNIHLNILG